MTQYVVTMVRPASAGGDREVTVRVKDADVARDGRPDAAARLARERAVRRLYGPKAIWLYDAQFPQRGQIMAPASPRTGASLSACTPVVVLHVGAYGIARGAS